MEPHDYQNIFQAMHNQLCNSKACKNWHRINPEYRMTVWLFMQQTLCLDSITVNQVAIQCIRKTKRVNYIVQPVQVRGWNPAYAESSIKNNLEIIMKQAIEYLKIPIIIPLLYYITSVDVTATYQDTAKWIFSALKNPS